MRNCNHPLIKNVKKQARKAREERPIQYTFMTGNGEVVATITDKEEIKRRRDRYGI